MNSPITQSMQVTTVSETTYAYLAGMIDGEGCIGIYAASWRRKDGSGICYRPTLIIVQRDPIIPQWLHGTFGGSLAHRVERVDEFKSGKRSYWRWYITGKNTGDLLQRCLPYLILKPEQAKCVIQLCETLLPGGVNWGSIPKNKPISKNRLGRVGRPTTRSPELIAIQESLYRRCRHLNSPSSS